MRSATVSITPKVLFDILGIKLFSGSLDQVSWNLLTGSIDLKISGDDERLPDSEKYPECNIVCKHIESHFEPRE